MTSYSGFRKEYSQSWIMKSVANVNMCVFKMCVFKTNESIIWEKVIDSLAEYDGILLTPLL